MTPVPTADRYLRQRAIPDWDQDLLAAATAVVVGVGALGNEVAKNLALLGVGRLVLCDPDVVDVTNLSRTVLFGPDDVGRPKVDAAAAALTRLAPDLAVERRRDDLARAVGLGELSSATVVLGCLDSRRARLRLLGRCALVEAPLVDGGTRPWGGEIRIRLDTAEACFGCTFTPAERAEQAVPMGCDADRYRAPAPASILSTSVVAGWMALAATRTVLGERPDWRFLDVDGTTATTGPVTARLDPTCPHHRPIGAVEPVGLTAASTAADLLAVLPPAAEPLTWERFPLPGACDHCGAATDFGGPGGSSRPCPSCGRWTRLRFSQRIRAARPDTALSALGVAPEEVVPVREGKGGYRWIGLSR